jgi:hypothetical protein
MRKYEADLSGKSKTTTSVSQAAFSLAETIGDLHTVMCEYCDGLPAYPIVYICAPVTRAWIHEYRNRMRDWSIKAVQLDTYETLPDQRYTSSVIDFFTALYQGMKALQANPITTMEPDSELSISVMEEMQIDTAIQGEVEKTERSNKFSDELGMASVRLAFFESVAFSTVSFVNEIYDKFLDNARNLEEVIPIEEHHKKKILNIFKHKDDKVETALKNPTEVNEKALSRMCLSLNNALETVERWKGVVESFNKWFLERKKDDDSEQEDGDEQSEENDDSEEKNDLPTTSNEAIDAVVISADKTLKNMLTMCMTDYVGDVLIRSTTAALPYAVSKSDLLDDRFGRLDDKLKILFEALHPSLFITILTRLFENTLLKIRDMLMPEPDVEELNEKQIQVLKDDVLKKLYDYFYAGGQGVNKEEMDRDFNSIKSLISFVQKPSVELITEYNSMQDKIRRFEDMLEKDITERMRGENEFRIMKSHYYFAVLYRRSGKAAEKKSKRFAIKQTGKVSVDLAAIEFIEAELLTLEAEAKKVDSQKSIMTKQIEELMKQEAEARQQISEIETTSAQLLEDFKKLKRLKKMVADMKKLRDSNRSLRKQTENEMEQIQEWNDRFAFLSKLLKQEMQIISKTFKQLGKSDKEIDKKKLETRLAPLMIVDKGKGAEVRKKNPSNRVTTTVKSIFIETKKHISGAPKQDKNEKKTSSVAMSIEYVFRAMRMLVDGYLCLATVMHTSGLVLSCTCWVSRSYAIGSDSSAIPLDFVQIECGSVKNINEAYFVGTIDNTIEFYEYDRETCHQFLFSDKYSRDAAFDAIQKFHVQKNRFFEQVRLIEDDTNVDIASALDFHRSLVNKKAKNRAVNFIQDVVPGYPISESLRRRFGISDLKVRLMAQVTCHESNTKQPGVLYVFTNSICFDPSVSIDNNIRVMVTFDDLSKLAKIKNSPTKSFTNGIKISDSNGRNWLYVGFGDYDADFLELCRGIRESRSTHRVIMKGDDIAAIMKSAIGPK